MPRIPVRQFKIAIAKMKLQFFACLKYFDAKRVSIPKVMQKNKPTPPIITKIQPKLNGNSVLVSVFSSMAPKINPIAPYKIKNIEKHKVKIPFTKYKILKVLRLFDVDSN